MWSSAVIDSTISCSSSYQNGKLRKKDKGNKIWSSVYGRWFISKRSWFKPRHGILNGCKLFANYYTITNGAHQKNINFFFKWKVKKQGL